MEKEFLFTNDWFNITAKRNWQSLLPQVKPTKILEVGSFEGNSICFLAENNDWCDELKVFCIDTWEGSIEHKERYLNMSEVEKRFDHNIELAQEISQKNIEVTKLKGFSDYHLSKLISDGFANYFDFVYVDGSHQAPDVLLDAVLAFKLIRVKGFIGFDDYTWYENLPYGKDPIRCPKFAIDAFTNIYFRKLEIASSLNRQMYVQKIAE